MSRYIDQARRLSLRLFNKEAAHQESFLREIYIPHIMTAAIRLMQTTPYEPLNSIISPSERTSLTRIPEQLPESEVTSRQISQSLWRLRFRVAQQSGEHEYAAFQTVETDLSGGVTPVSLEVVTITPTTQAVYKGVFLDAHSYENISSSPSTTAHMTLDQDGGNIITLHHPEADGVQFFRAGEVVDCNNQPFLYFVHREITRVPGLPADNQSEASTVIFQAQLV